MHNKARSLINQTSGFLVFLSYNQDANINRVSVKIQIQTLFRFLAYEIPISSISNMSVEPPGMPG